MMQEKIDVCKKQTNAIFFVVDKEKKRLICVIFFWKFTASYDLSQFYVATF